MWFLIALIVPFFLVLLFTRVTYNHYVGTLLTAALLVASYMKGYTNEWYEIFADIASTGAGFLVAEKMVRNMKN